ncbi:L-rhamnose mutarotase [Paenibacillus radicis (ex Xue et al. 2023)]|uniref:L-rhamnose mutarotase n=1 Tax=Paenibacillus radicis (ex Xue et al. 2023) TaxID=2972489 RepID=A0ABT1Y9H2_9BACL|nr:L-rhamnose mutarotase [Paenibacillus radicis (ex Xue et al. 2023)]MCR8629841.1 L-rhamnose mutarotase [Paenibacillus radicis (ex Xue et al. 2023)]
MSFVLKIDPNDAEAYQKRHEKVDPELEEQFRAVGIHSYHIFLHEGTLFVYMAVDNFEEAMKSLQDHPANVRWQAYMSDMLEVWESGSTVKAIPAMYHFVKN